MSATIATSTTADDCYSDDISSGSEFECESGSERMMYKSGDAHKRALPTLSQPPSEAATSSIFASDTATLPHSSVQWPKRLVIPKNGLGEAHLASVNDPHYYMVIDVETSGSTWGVHMPVAVACAVLCVVMRESHWEVRVVATHLACYLQQDMAFERGILDPGGFWHRHRHVLETLNLHAQQAALPNNHVTAALAFWWDDAMMRYNYPHVWSDNPVFDAGQISMLFGIHLNRPGLAFVRHPHLPNEYIYARPAQHTNTICMDLIHPSMTHMIDHAGAPSFMNYALKHQALGKLSSIKYDHNPLNDVQRVALNFGRLLCRWVERRTAHDSYLLIHCYLQDASVPLAVEPARAIHYSCSSSPRDGAVPSLRTTTRKTYRTTAAQESAASSSSSTTTAAVAPNDAAPDAHQRGGRKYQRRHKHYDRSTEYAV